MKLIVFKSTTYYVGQVDEGPWGDDYAPMGSGKTPEEAADKAWNDLLEVQKEINDFCSQGKPKFELI